MTIRGIPPAILPISAQPRPAAPISSSRPLNAEPGLWFMLSPAERAFFMPVNGEASIGYGRSGSAARTAPLLGQRLDVVG